MKQHCVHDHAEEEIKFYGCETNTNQVLLERQHTDPQDTLAWELFGDK